MSRSRRIDSAGIAIAVGALLAGCGSSSSGGDAESAGLPTDGPTAAPTAQTCQDRLHGTVSGPSEVFPRLAGTRFQSQQPANGLYSGLLPGVDNKDQAANLRQQFVTKGFSAGKVKTTATASRFTFKGTNSGTVIVAVLCQGHLRVIYQIKKG